LLWSASVLVTSVDRTSPAGHAGLSVGDLIDERDISVRERWLLRGAREDWVMPANERVTYPVHRGAMVKTISFVTRRHIESLAFTDWVNAVGGLWSIVLAAILAARRPDVRQARFLSLLVVSLFGFGSLNGSFVTGSVFIDIPLAMLAGAIIFGGPTVSLALLASTYARPLSALRKVLLGAAIFFAAAHFIGTYVIFVVGWYVLALPLEWLRQIPTPSLGLAAALCALIAAATAAHGAERNRVLWILLSVGPYSLWLVIIGFIFASQSVENAISTVSNVAIVSIPIALTYAVLSRKCVDVGYVLNRTLVFGAISAVVIAVFIIVEYALDALLTNVSHTTSFAIGMVIALGLGLSMRLVHRRVERAVDLVFFRKRHEDEAALRQFAREAPFITDIDTLFERTKREIIAHAGATTVETLVRAGGRYVTEGGDSIDENDPAVLTMRASHGPVEIHRCATNLRGECAFPMTSRGDVVGILVCGTKSDGQAYAPDESSTLITVAQAVGSVLGSLLDRSDGMGEVLAELRAIRALLSEVVVQDRSLSPD
jgi:hypothetical protein